MNIAKKIITAMAVLFFTFNSYSGLPEKIPYAKVRDEIKNTSRNQWITLFGSFTSLVTIRVPNEFGGKDRNFQPVDEVGYLTAIADLCETKSVRFVEDTSARVKAYCLVK